ncbi:cholesterol 7-desaturase nvd 1-like isoform X1 [Centruroides vittatus]|uniref:cholesterol 7-desaturase nvd 1-like isoform X1 n=1 Tax=Centruroides vittatus TaxID=120091 RepID=UPI0035104B31
MFTFLNDLVTKELCKYSRFLDMFQCINTAIMNKPYLILLLVVLILIVYFSLSTHNKVVDMTDIGYNDRRASASKLYKKRLQLLKETNRWRSPDEIPPAYPNGRIPLLESRDLSVGECKPVTAIGRQFVIFRGKTGKSFVLDAYCPHLGANLGIDGKIHEDCIECPFHGWRFSGHDGSCVKIPYAEKAPKVANIKRWETIEQNGFIYVWHHAEGQPPLWKPAVISEIEDGLWHCKGRTEHIINCHIQIGPAIIHSYLQSDFGNSAFVQSVIPEGPFRQRFIRHYYSPSRFSTLLDRIAMFWESRLIERDVRIWNYKMYLKNPVYVSEDRTIAKFRKWYAQFYSENSPRAEVKSLNW